MILRSHGPESSLLEHTMEVMACATNLEERVAAACHDIGKASVSWQNYIRQEHGESPHPHAAAGGVLAACVLLLAGKAESVLRMLHATAAHHGYLSTLDADDLNGLEKIAMDAQARTFFLDRQQGIASLLPEISRETLEKAWELFSDFSILSFQEMHGWQKSGEPLLKDYLSCRDFLGRICFADQMSAKKQSDKVEHVPRWQDVYANPPFRKRHMRKFAIDSPIATLRTKLTDSFLEIVEDCSWFYFIDAPTGLGKTEAMLRGAERIREKLNLEKIIYAIPQVSIADQIYEDYFNENDSAEIWNYLRKESKEKEEPDSSGDETALVLEVRPFVHSYNVTTFNQVLLAMCHPNRFRCIRSLGLRNAVIIFDEFHKLPMPILPIFFRLAREYGEMHQCRFIFGSATPLESLEYWNLTDMRRIPPFATCPIYENPLVNERRMYQFIGSIQLSDLIEKIQRFHEESREKNLLVVVNLVGKASWPLRQYFCGGYFPWRDLNTISTPSEERKIVVLDGLVPPCLRRSIVKACGEIMQNSPGKLTLISTQMIEVGVDLDFDAAMIDYQGIASVIQRGGRVGRSGRSNPCAVEVFSLDIAGKTTFDILCEIPSEQKNTVLDEAVNLELKFRRKEKKFFEKKKDNSEMAKDTDLAQKLSDLQRKCFDSPEAISKSNRLIDKVFGINSGSATRLGACFENGQYVAEMYSEGIGDPILVFQNIKELKELFDIEQKIKNQGTTQQERENFFLSIVQHRIVVGYGILQELNLQHYRDLEIPEALPVYVVDAGNVM